ncbi:MAG: hypothetical protein AAGG80_01260 [Pseudomonadota bacterium]
MNNQPFKRNNLAQAYCDNLQGNGITNAASGLFLAGPRRVGKSTFLLNDLIPEAKQRHWTTVYVDLWANKRADPALLITEAVKAAILSYKSKLGKLIKRFKVQKINILKTVELDFSQPGLPENITITDLLKEFVILANKPILLIIDEAQHALTSKNGINAMFSIKSARDQINIKSSTPQLMLVLTGSNRDKLAQLIIKKEQPFFGSEVTTFPLLNRDFTDDLTDKVNNALEVNNQFNKNDMWEAFQMIGHRPEILRQLIGRVAINNDAESFSKLLKQDAFIWHSQIWQEFENEFNQLPALHQSILTLLIKEKHDWSPFSESSMQYYQQSINQPRLSIATVQTAIQSLREKGFIWQSSRGVYALEDESFAQWFKHTH